MILLLVLLPSALGQIMIIKRWNGVSNSKDEEAILAVRTSGDIEHCTWTNRDADEPKTYRLNEDDEVELDEGDRLCKLTLEDVDKDEHAGEWTVKVYGSCDGDEEEFDAPSKSKKSKNRSKKRGKRRRRRRRRRKRQADGGQGEVAPPLVTHGGGLSFLQQQQQQQAAGRVRNRRTE